MRCFFHAFRAHRFNPPRGFAVDDQARRFGGDIARGKASSPGGYKDITFSTVSPDGKYLFFTLLNFKTNTGFIYWVSAGIIDKLKAEALSQPQRLHDKESK